MEFIFKQIEEALSKHIYYLALFCAASIPDICSALETVNNATDKNKYKKWFTEYIVPIDPKKYGAEGNLKEDDLWKIRCSLFHQGKTTNQNEYKRMLFIEPPNQTYSIHCCIVGYNTSEQSLLIEIDKFCKDIINGGRTWVENNKNNQNYIKNHETLVQRYPEGIKPVKGMPVIG
jgi:hypothetical protein